MNDAVRIKRFESRRDRELAAIGAVRDLTLAALENPVVDFLAGLAFISYLRTQANRSGPESWSQHLVNDVGQFAAGGTIGAICTAKALGPALISPAADALVSKFVK